MPRPRESRNGHAAEAPVPALPSVVWTRALLTEIAEREHGPQIRAARAQRRAEALSLLRRVVKLLEQDA